MAEMASQRCCICGIGGRFTPADSGGFGIFECDRCGKYKLRSEPPKPSIVRPEEIYKLASLIRACNRDGETPMITQELLKAARTTTDRTLEEKSRLVLEYLASKTKYFGEEVEISRNLDYPVVFAQNDSEFFNLLKMHQELNHIAISNRDEEWDYLSVVLKATGFAALEVARRARPNAATAFVAMHFADELKPIYTNQIEPAIRDAGYKPIRIDLEQHNDDILARIMTEIRIAKFVVADFTGHRNGVYFEAGFAKGLGLEVVWLCRESDIKDAHFDTNHFNHLVWKDDGSLRAHLTARILATIGPGPNYKSLPPTEANSPTP